MREDGMVNNMVSCGKIEDLLQSLAEKLRKAKWMMGTAESCTGGGIGALCTSVPGASDWFAGGFITYTNECKQRMLGVSRQTLNRYGAVSQETVTEMLHGILENGKMQAGVAVSGIAGPGGAVPGKPVGTVYIGAVTADDIVVRCFHFDGDRDAVRRQTAVQALQMLDGLLAPSH